MLWCPLTDQFCKGRVRTGFVYLCLYTWLCLVLITTCAVLINSWYSLYGCLHVGTEVFDIKHAEYWHLIWRRQGRWVDRKHGANKIMSEAWASILYATGFFLLCLCFTNHKQNPNIAPCMSPPPHVRILEGCDYSLPTSSYAFTLVYATKHSWSHTAFQSCLTTYFSVFIHVSVLNTHSFVCHQTSVVHSVTLLADPEL
jgi:hypothetical protein